MTAERPDSAVFVRSVVVRVPCLAVVAQADCLEVEVEAPPVVLELFPASELDLSAPVAAAEAPSAVLELAVLEPDQLARVVAAVVAELSPELVRYVALEVVEPAASVRHALAVLPVRPEFWVVQLLRVVQLAFVVSPGHAVAQAGFQVAVAAALHASADQHRGRDSAQLRVGPAGLDLRQRFVVRP